MSDIQLEQLIEERTYLKAALLVAQMGKVANASRRKGSYLEACNEIADRLHVLGNPASLKRDNAP